MAEFVMKDMVRREGLERNYEIASAATSREEIGNPIYQPAGRKLAEKGVAYDGHRARQMTKADYSRYDLIVCMDHANLRNARQITGGDPAHKLVLLLDSAGRPGQEVADPWYTGNFDAAWDDIAAGCAGLIEKTRAASAGSRTRR